MGPLVEFFGDRIIIDFGLERDARLTYIIAGKEWIWPPPRSSKWIEIIRCTPTSFLLKDERRDLVCWKDATRLFSLFVVLETLFVLFGTKLSDGNLFGINMLFRNIHLSCGLLFMNLSLLKIISNAMVLFKLSMPFMLITYSLSAHSLIAFGLIYSPEVSFPFLVALRLAPSIGSLIWVEVTLFIMCLRDWC